MQGVEFVIIPELSPLDCYPSVHISLADRDWALGQDLEGDRKIVGKWFHRICLWLHKTSPPPPIPAAPPR